MQEDMKEISREVKEIIEITMESKKEIFDSYINRDVILEEKGEDLLLLLITFMECYSIMKEMIPLDSFVLEYDDLDNYTIRNLLIMRNLIKNEMKLLMKELIKFEDPNIKVPASEINLQIDEGKIVSIFNDWVSECLANFQIDNDDIGLDKRLELVNQIKVWDKIFDYYNSMLDIVSFPDKNIHNMSRRRSFTS